VLALLLLENRRCVFPVLSSRPDLSCLGVLLLLLLSIALLQPYQEPGKEDVDDRYTEASFNVTVSNLIPGESCTMYKFSGLMPNRQLPQVCMAGSCPAKVPLGFCARFEICQNALTCICRASNSPTTA
jgi:hypothetical protein